MLSALSEAGLQESLPHGVVRVWQARLVLDPITFAKAVATLDTRERERAESFKYELDRARFIAGRGWLRWLLGRYMSVAPEHVSIEPDENGKPFLAGEAGRRLQFNASNSGDLALYAFTRAGLVGVDLEKVQDDFPVLEVADRFFSKPERKRLAGLPPADRPRAFYECWTRKEAYLKAIGVGLALPLDQFSVTFGPGTLARLSSATDRRLGRRWSVHPVAVASGYEAAVVVAAGASIAVQLQASTCSDWRDDTPWPVGLDGAAGIGAQRLLGHGPAGLRRAHGINPDALLESDPVQNSMPLDLPGSA
jgi:4'-phosphopantetheinyl transferase